MSERERPPEGAVEMDEPEAAGLEIGGEKEGGLALEEMPGAVIEEVVERASSPEQQKIDAWVREKKIEAARKKDEFVIGHERRKAEVAALLNEPAVREGALKGDVEYFLKAFDRLKDAHTRLDGFRLVVPNPQLEEDYQLFLAKSADFSGRVRESGRLNPGNEARFVSNIAAVHKRISDWDVLTPESWTREAKKALGIP